MSMSIICGSAMAFWHQHIGLFMTQKERWLAIRERTVMTGIRKLNFLKTMLVVIGWGMHKYHSDYTLIDIGWIFLLRLNHAGSFQLRQYAIHKYVRLLLAVLLATKNWLLNDVASNTFYLVATFVVCKQLCGIWLQQRFSNSGSKQAFNPLPCEYSTWVYHCTHNYIICCKITKSLGENCDLIHKLHII